jgi:hypothetical protein
MLEIERLQLQLPTGFERRAPRISRLVAEQLALRGVSDSRRIERLRAGPVRVSSSDSDRRVAAAIARAIHGAIDAAPPGGSEP